MKVFSKASVYGIRALVFLAAEKKHSGYVSIGEISEKLNISFHFLTKTFQTLTKEGILESHRGPFGGVALLKDPSEITLLELIRILEGEQFFDTCLLGLPGCGKEDPCPVHAYWKEVKTHMQQQFTQTTLEELGDRVSDERMRLIT